LASLATLRHFAISSTVCLPKASGVLRFRQQTDALVGHLLRPCLVRMRWWEKLNSIPDKPTPPRGWVAIELFVPRSHVDEVRRVVEALYPQPKANAKRKGPASVRVRPVKESQRGTAPRAKRPTAP